MAVSEGGILREIQEGYFYIKITEGYWEEADEKMTIK
jgi:hypothetical protein